MKKLVILLLVVVLAAFIIALAITSSNNNQYPLSKSAVVDRILVEKGKRKLHVYQQGELLKTYDIALGPILLATKKS